MSIREDFFTALSNGAKWDVGVSIARTNPLPLDANSVFKSYADLETYCEGVLAYVGQPVAVVTETDTTLYVLDQTLTPQPVGTPTEGDAKSIDLADGILGLHDFGKYFYKYVPASGTEGEEDYRPAHYEKTQVTPETPWAAGLAPQVVADGNNLVIGWYEQNPTTIEGVNSQVTALQSTVADNTSRIVELESGVEELETALAPIKEKIDGIGGIFNFAGAVDADTFANMNASDYEAGDVILVDGVKEYVCVETGDAKRWEVLGDPSGVTALQGVVDQLTEDVRQAEADIDNLESDAAQFESDIEALQEKDIELANAIAEKATKTDLNDAVARIGVNEKAIEALEQKDINIESELATKATTEYVDNKVTEINGKIEAKADKETVNNLVTNAATKSELETGLASKVDSSTYESKISELESADAELEDAVEAARGIADQNKTDIQTINTELAKKALASDLSALETRVGTAEGTISGHTSSINSINGSISSLEANKAEVSALTALTNRVKANEDNISAHQTAYETLLGRVNGHDIAIQNAQKDATQALSDASAAASAAVEAKGKGEEALAKALEVLGASTDTADKNTVYGAKAAAATADAKAVTAQGEVDALEIVVSKLDEAYKSADVELDSRIAAIEEVIGGVQGAMHFVGVSSTDPADEVTINDVKYCGAVGDVVLYNQKEYVCIVAGTNAEGVVASGTWAELGDVSAEAQRIGVLESYNTNTVAPIVAKIPTIENGISENTSALAALAERVAANEAYKTTNNEALAALSERVTANANAIAKEITDRDNAVKAEATARETAISNEASAREEAVSGLQDQIDEVIAKLTWTKLN